MGELSVKRTLSIMDGTGDSKIVWDADKEDEVAIARTAFEEARARGMVAFSLSERGDKDEVIAEFDPQAERIILAPPLRGGVE